jgi:hypothetical protein
MDLVNVALPRIFVVVDPGGLLGKLRVGGAQQKDNGVKGSVDPFPPEASFLPYRVSFL